MVHPAAGQPGTDVWGNEVDAALAALPTTYASTVPAIMQPSKNGIRYDGTDETAAMQSLINGCLSFGVGVIGLEGVVRCDGQLVIPNSGGTQPRQAPLRITGTVQNMPGSTFTTTTPFPAASGLDLRYAGRTDTGCTTTLGSTLIDNPAAVAGDRGLILTGPGIPDQCWILAVSPGVGYSVTAAARATATVALTTFGGRIQTLGYGNLEIDHIQLMNSGATASDAPFILSTATKIELHHCLVLGHTSHSSQTCTEDPLVMGGPGQGTMLTSALTSGTVYTTIAVAAMPCASMAGGWITLNNGTNTQVLTATSAVAAGATSITVTSFTANANYAVRVPVYIGGSVNQQFADAWSVPSAPFQGYGTRVHDNHFHRIRRIVAGGFTSSVHVDHNSFMHNCGSNLAAKPSTLTTALTAASVYTTLAVTALSRAVIAGDVIQIGVATSQETIASAPASVGATSLTVTSFTANAAYPTSTVVFNSTNGIGAPVESYALPGSVNSVGVAHNRIGFSGGYTHATRFAGQTQNAVIDDNDFQDCDYSGAMIAGHRFDRDAQSNLVIPALMSGQPTIDDWSDVTHSQAQTVLEHAQSRPSKFPAGIDTVGAASTYRSSGGAYTYAPTYLLGTGETWQTWTSASSFWLTNTPAGGSGVNVCRWQNDPSGVNLTQTMNATNEAQFYNTAGHMRFGVKAGYKVYLGDATYPSSAYVDQGTVHANALTAKAYTTALRPSAASVGVGGQVYDSTLGIPIWSDGTVWRNAMGTAV